MKHQPIQHRPEAAAPAASSLPLPGAGPDAQAPDDREPPPAPHNTVRAELVEAPFFPSSVAKEKDNPSTGSGRTEGGEASTPTEITPTPDPEPDLAAYPVPVPVRARHDGWTPDRQRCFLEALARCGSVRSAAMLTGLSRETAYRLKRRPDALAFSRAWDAALILARDLYAEELLDKARNGWRETVWYHGEEVGERERFSPQLLLAALARLDARADGLDFEGNPARVAAGQFDELVAAIADERDPAALIAAQDAAAVPPYIAAEESDRDLIDRIKRNDRIAAINAMDPAAIDTADLDIAQADDWDDEQWARAERSGFLDSAFWDDDDEESGDGEAGEGDDGGDAPGECARDANIFPLKGV